MTPSVITTKFEEERMDLDRKANGTTKRKHSPGAPVERPTKQRKPEAYAYIEGEATPTGNLPIGMDRTPSGYDGVESDDEGKILPLAAATADTAEWQATIERVVRSVVSIHFCQTCSFDTDASCSSEATGFVVDAERGYIMTNRHVVCAGPFWGYCIFDNHEEVRSD